MKQERNRVKRAVLQSSSGLQDSKSSAQGEKRGMTGAGKCRREDGKADYGMHT